MGFSFPVVLLQEHWVCSLGSVQLLLGEEGFLRGVKPLPTPLEPACPSASSLTVTNSSLLFRRTWLHGRPQVWIKRALGKGRRRDKTSHCTEGLQQTEATFNSSCREGLAASFLCCPQSPPFSLHFIPNICLRAGHEIRAAPPAAPFVQQ